MVRISIADSEDSFEIDEGDTILRAALRAGYGMPYSCNVGSCGNCKFTLVEGNVAHLRKDAPAMSERDLKRQKWLGCQALPDGDCTIKFRADPEFISLYKPTQNFAKLVSVHQITRDISEFRFTKDGPEGFLPGQYALLNFLGVEGGRPYSMCNLPDDGYWSFQIKKVLDGAATTELFNLQIGTMITIDGPYSTAFLREDVPRDIILIAGGSGLSPMVSIARQVEATQFLSTRKVHFYYGCREEADLFNPSDLPHPMSNDISFVAALSNTSHGHHRKGFLHQIVAADFPKTLKDHEIYFAGPSIMSAAIQKMAYEAGVSMKQLHFDEFF